MSYCIPWLCLPLSCMRFLTRSRGCTNSVADILGDGRAGGRKGGGGGRMGKGVGGGGGGGGEGGRGEGAESNELLSPMNTPHCEILTDTTGYNL